MNYKLHADAAGTSLTGYFYCSYADLVAAFGEPNCAGDNYKVSSEWNFIDDDGHKYSIYDYKETRLYDGELPTVEEFRALDSYEWHVGAETRRGFEQFVYWLRMNVKGKQIKQGNDNSLPSQQKELGEAVRDAWVEWAKQQPNPKPSWLVPWSELDEVSKSADRAIEEHLLKSYGNPIADDLERCTEVAEAVARILANVNPMPTAEVLCRAWLDINSLVIMLRNMTKRLNDTSAQ